MQWQKNVTYSLCTGRERLISLKDNFVENWSFGTEIQVQVQVRFIICRLDAIKYTLYIKIICKSKTKITFFTTGDWKGPVTVI